MSKIKDTAKVGQSKEKLLKKEYNNFYPILKRNKTSDCIKGTF